jgi:hypothetical protein
LQIPQLGEFFVLIIVIFEKCGKFNVLIGIVIGTNSPLN